MMSNHLQELSDAGVSIWLDDLSRERLATGNLADLVESSSVVGVTTNPTIFAAALANGEQYDQQMRELAGAGADVEDAVRALTTDDVRHACDVFAGTYRATGGYDGRVSIEVQPGLARDTDGTVAEAAELFTVVDRPNVLIKIPATREGLPAITRTIAAGISVNVTLIFALERYRDVIDAYLDGLEQAAADGHDLSSIHSVASFFISRVDSEVDKRLDTLATEEAAALKHQAALANARLAYAQFQERFASPRWTDLEARGANRQRPLWASTGVKDPDLPDTAYVSGLVVDGTVNTMPEKTLRAFADHGEVDGDTVTDTSAQAQQFIDRLKAAGIDLDDVYNVLEREGLDKFDHSWTELVHTVSTALDDAHAGKDSPGESADPDVTHDSV